MSFNSPTRRRRSACGSTLPGAQVSDLSRQLLRAQEEERKRISRELHDGTGQGLMVLRLYLGMLATDGQSPQAQLKAEEALKLLDHTIEDLRRIIGRLSPRVLEELGLLAAVRKEARELSKNTGIKAQLVLPKNLGLLDHEIEVAIYRSLQEALHNIAKHSQAKSLKVQIDRDRASIYLWVEDDGVGFSGKPSSRARAFGLLGMKERVAALGGKVRIRSVKGSGTRIRIVLPAPVLRGEEFSELGLPAGFVPGSHPNSASELRRFAVAR